MKTRQTVALITTASTVTTIAAGSLFATVGAVSPEAARTLWTEEYERS